MGGAYQLLDLLLIALAILVVLFLLAFLVSRLFQSRRTRKWILWGSLTVYALAFFSYFAFLAFVLSGNVN